MSSGPLLEAIGVHKELRGGEAPVQAVRGVDLAIMPGDFVAITGPSGGGKSTLLHMLGALDRPSSGEVRLGGRSTSALSDAELARLRAAFVGFVFQFHFLLPELNALENVALPLRVLGRPRAQAEARAAELLGAFGLQDRATHRPHALSGGQQQRVAIARALANSPPLLLGDEPTGNLDTANSRQVFEWLRRNNRESGQTIVVVTHNPELAAMADRVLRFVDGRVEGA